MSAPEGSRSRSWAEMRQTLHQLRRSLSSLSARSPQNFSFRRLSDRRLRVYFLSARSGSDNQLCFVDLTATLSASLCDDTKLPWQQLFDAPLQSPRCVPQSSCFTMTTPPAPPGDGSSRCSRDEQLLLERKRVVGWGITEYNMHEMSGRFVFTSGGSIYHVTDADNRVSLSPPLELPSMRYHTRLNATMCPANPDLIAYVEDGDIWVANSRTGADDRLTFVRACDETLSAGLPSYVVQEEFSRFVGFWWCPESKDGVYRLLYEEIDESHVELIHLSTQNHGSGTESIRYPRAGANNSVSSLKLVQFRVSDSGGAGVSGVCDVTQLTMTTPLNALFPWAEYLVRVCWMDDGGVFVCCQLLDRAQCRLDIVLVPVALFLPPPPSSPLPPADYTSQPHCMLSLPVQVLLSVHSEVWINVHDVLHVLPSSDPDQISFLWLDETSGYTHLAKVSAQIVRQARPGYSIHYNRSVSKLMLTSGEWNVATNDIWVSHERGLVFFQGNRESPVERQLYVTSYESAGPIQLLTTPGYYHTAHMNQDCTALVTLVSNLSTPPICRAWRVHYNTSSSSSSTASCSGPEGPEPSVRLLFAGLILEPRAYQAPPWLPQLHSISVPSSEGGSEGGRQQLFCMVYPPVGWTAGRRYPTVVSVYGGPQVQVVTRAFKGYRNLRSHILAAEGYCVVTIDSRGSHNRGIQFEGHIKNRMGTVEIQDQVDALHQLADRLGLIDLSRVAIMGWSYGGYLSLMALTQRPDVFRIAVAGAPVISWTLYDTGYTERYMDLPCRNPCGYEAGSVLSYANQFPSEPNRLLIFHGLCDENVHFFHTRQLISALIRAGKPYQLQVYPNERHSLRALESSEHFELTLLSFLNSHL